MHKSSSVQWKEELLELHELLKLLEEELKELLEELKLEELEQEELEQEELEQEELEQLELSALSKVNIDVLSKFSHLLSVLL